MKLEVAKIDKAHGLRGEVVVTLVTDRFERVAPGTVLSHEEGTLTVESSKPHHHRFLVKFAEIPDRESAEAARGTILFADPLEDPDVLWVHELVGNKVLDTDGAELGTVESVEENPASDLLVLDGGRLVPLTFYVETTVTGSIVVDPPDGLFDPVEPDLD